MNDPKQLRENFRAKHGDHALMAVDASIAAMSCLMIGMSEESPQIKFESAMMVVDGLAQSICETLGVDVEGSAEDASQIMADFMVACGAAVRAPQDSTVN